MPTQSVAAARVRTRNFALASMLALGLSALLFAATAPTHEAIAAMGLHLAALVAVLAVSHYRQRFAAVLDLAKIADRKIDAFVVLMREQAER